MSEFFSSNKEILQGYNVSPIIHEYCFISASVVVNLALK